MKPMHIADLRIAANDWIKEFALSLKNVGLYSTDHPRGKESIARSYLKLRDTVIIVIAALSDPRDETAALNVGADMFFAKPMGPDLLQARLKPLIRRLYDKLGG